MNCMTLNEFSKDFEEILTQAAENYTDATLALIDVDNFLHVNEDFGHSTGDEVLLAISDVLLKMEANKNVYRYSGDEYAVIFTETEKEEAFLVMEKARKDIENLDICKKTASTVSIGIASYAEDGTRQADIFRKADSAMYRAKSSGRNKVCLAKEEKLVTKTAHYTTEQLKRLKTLAETTKTGEAALMREALDLLLKKYDK